jgi:hypothetical protein
MKEIITTPLWDLPWINTNDYSIYGLIVNGIGCIFWVAAYAVLVYNIYKKKFVEMPAYVAGANFGWEFIWSFFFHPTTGRLFGFAYIGAFLLDIYIFYSIIRYGTKQPMNMEFKKHFTAYALINFLFWIGFSYTFGHEGLDNGIGGNSGYIINVIISLQCLAMLFQIKETSNFSLLFAWCRTLGTGFITVSAFIFYPENSFIKLLGTSCFIMDMSFITVLKLRHGKWI